VKSRWILVACTLLAACGFTLSVQGGRWWEVGEATVGPLGTQRCFSGDCQPTGLEWLGGGMPWLRFAIATSAAAFIAAFVNVVLAATLAARRTPRLFSKLVLASVITAGAAGAMFVVQFPSDMPATMARGIAFYVAAVALGLVAPIAVLRRG
jgi:hypothetical protein